MKELPNPEKQTRIYASLYYIIFEKKKDRAFIRAGCLIGIVRYVIRPISHGAP